MRILVTAIAILSALAVCTEAATTPGTILSTTASVTYKDSSGQAMPQVSSNTGNVLVVPSDPRSVMMTIRSMTFGPSTVGKTITLVGNITVDANGTWLDDGSTVATKARNADGTTVYQNLYTKVSTIFLTSPPTSGRMIVTGISQIDTDGTRVIIPSSDNAIRTLTPLRDICLSEVRVRRMVN